MNTPSLPLSLQRHEAYQSEYYARLRQIPGFTMAANVIEAFLQIIVAEGNFYLRVHRKKLPQILESECIKSMTETGTGTTVGGPETRKQAVRELFGCATDRMQPADYPKYGYLAAANPRMELFMGDEMAYQYGNALLTLDKGKLMPRTTLCVGSSLGMGHSGRLVPTRTSHPLATCLPGLPSDKAAPHNPAADANFYLYFAHAIATRRITKQNFHRITEILGCEVPSFEFFELQYHGPLTLRDIQGITLYDEGDTAFLREMQAAFAAKGVALEIAEL